jgi:phosphatidylglycerol:prolipoprotein diacylglycerol transferase
MYPRLSDLFKDYLGFELPFPIYSFGFMVAIAVMLAAWITQKELDRMYRLGRVPGVKVRPDQKGKARGRHGSAAVVSPSTLMGTVTVIAVLAGFAGAKVFHILENLDSFLLAPGQMIFSTGGFTFYGGLVVAALSIAWYVRRNGVPVPVFADAVAPGLMLAYGVGRIGCHLSGDGDWGIPADLSAQPSWFPDWLWAETYPNNILGMDLSAHPVYPTPLYEFAAAVVLFAVLMALRNHPFRAGWLISLYLVLNGLERFFIEKIRVNNVMDLFGIESTQAELIAVLLVALGLYGMFRQRGRREPSGPAPAPPVPEGD